MPYVGCDKRLRRHTRSLMRCACALLVTPYELDKSTGFRKTVPDEFRKIFHRHGTVIRVLFKAGQFVNLWGVTSGSAGTPDR